MACYPPCPRSRIQSPGHKRRESWVKPWVDLWVHEPHSTRDALTPASATERQWAMWSIALWWNRKTWRVCRLSEGGLSLDAIEILSHRLCSCSPMEWCPTPGDALSSPISCIFPLSLFSLRLFFFYPSFVNLWCGWGINRSLKSGHKYCLSFISGLFIVGTLKLVAVSRDGCTCGPLITVTGKREHGVGREMAGGRTWWVGYDQYTLYKFRESLSCRDCCTVKSTCYSCWWPKFNSQHPQGGL